MAFKQSLQVVAITVLAVSQNAQSTSLYLLDTLGFYDAEHTRDDGYQYNAIEQRHSNGYITGNAQRFNGGSTYLGRTTWLYDGTMTHNIGLLDAEHTRSYGYRNGSSSRVNAFGQVLGVADRFNGGNTPLGQSVWLYDGVGTQKIGLTGIEHTRNDGYKAAFADALDDSGRAAGTSYRYIGAVQQGQSSWLYDGSTTVQTGLFDIEHTRSGGYQFSRNQDMNNAGHVVGFSSRHNNTNSALGNSAWLYNGSSVQNISLTDAEHTSNTDVRSSVADAINENGAVIGYSARYNGTSSYLGQSTWIRDGTSTQIIGLRDTEHTGVDGSKWSGYQYFTESGKAAGRSERYGVAAGGQSVWVYDSAATHNVGLTGVEHTRSDNYKFSSLEAMNEAGHVAGESNRYNGTGTWFGQSAWVYDGSTTMNVGLTDAEHTRDDGHQFSNVLPNGLNASGQAVGKSQQYNGGATALGYSAWMFDGTTTHQIGLTGATYTGADGYQLSAATHLNNSGQVAGYSIRYGAGGQTAWFYDSATDTTFSGDLSVRSDGFAYSQALFLGDDGLMLGYYNLFDDVTDLLLGQRVFGFNMMDGFFDLGVQIDGGVELYNWDVLANAWFADNDGSIYGTGLLDGMTSGEQAVFAAHVSSVPVPAAVWLFGSGLIGLIGIARRKTRT